MTQIGEPKRIIEIPLPSERPQSEPSVEPSTPSETPSPGSPVPSQPQPEPVRTPSEPLVPA